MHKTNNLHRVTDDAKSQVVAAIETVKAQAAATAEEIGRATRKTIHGFAQGATEEALSSAASKAKSLQSEVENVKTNRPSIRSSLRLSRVS